ncbi:hypothetical protein Tco_1201507, partial [Tanacetum coccineum]
MIPPTAPTTHYTSPFIHTDSSDDDTPDTPPSPTHEIPPVEVAPPTGQILPAPFGVRRRRVTIISPRQPIPYGRLYRYHPNGPMIHQKIHHQIHHQRRHSSSDALSDSSSGHSSSDHSSPALPSVLLAVPYHICNDISPVPGALSSVRADLLPPRKRIRSFDYATDLEDCSDERIKSFVPRKTSLRDDVDVRGSDEPYSELDIDPEIQAKIDECIAYAHATRAEGIDARVAIKTVAREEVEMSARSTVKVKVYKVTHHVVSDDIPKPAQEEGAIEITYEMLGDLIDQGHRIVVTGQLSAVQSERISKLKRDNTRLRGMTMPNTQSGAIMTREAVNELIARQVAEALEAREAARNLKPITEGGDDQGGKNGDDYEGGNGGGNGNGNRNGRVNGNGNRGFMPVARECTYQDVLKCQPFNFKGAEGVVGLTRWRFQELVLLCTIMVPDEEDKVKRFIGGLPDNIQGNVVASEPTRLQDAICIAKNLMDQKLKGYARSAENKR